LENKKLLEHRCQGWSNKNENGEKMLVSAGKSNPTKIEKHKNYWVSPKSKSQQIKAK